MSYLYQYSTVSTCIRLCFFEVTHSSQDAAHQLSWARAHEVVYVQATKQDATNRKAERSNKRRRRGGETLHGIKEGAAKEEGRQTRTDAEKDLLSNDGAERKCFLFFNAQKRKDKKWRGGPKKCGRLGGTRRSRGRRRCAHYARRRGEPPRLIWMPPERGALSQIPRLLLKFSPFNRREKTRFFLGDGTHR